VNLPLPGAQSPLSDKIFSSPADPVICGPLMTIPFLHWVSWNGCRVGFYDFRTIPPLWMFPALAPPHPAQDPKNVPSFCLFESSCPLTLSNSLRPCLSRHPLLLFPQSEWGLPHLYKNWPWHCLFGSADSSPAACCRLEPTRSFRSRGPFPDFLSALRRADPDFLISRSIVARDPSLYSFWFSALRYISWGFDDSLPSVYSPQQPCPTFEEEAAPYCSALLTFGSLDKPHSPMTFAVLDWSP